MKAQKLFDILAPDEIKSITGSLDVEVHGFQIDSREIKGGEVFVAMKGSNSDGHDYIKKAMDLGASLIVCEEQPDYSIDKPIVVLKNLRHSIGRIVHHYFGNEKGQMAIIGVTGTNGKSTVATLLFQLFTELGYKAGLMSTVENRIGSEVLKATHTTPDVIAMGALLKQMRSEHVSHVFMEVSSHGLDQGRVNGVPFDGALFTNISHDHLDYHHTMKEYIKAKKIFFDDLNQESFALVNEDDRNGRVMVQNSSARVKGYALKTMTDYKIKIIQDSILGLHIKINEVEFFARLSGAFNAYNLAAAYGTAMELGEDRDEVIKVLSMLQGAEGRMEKVQIEGVQKIGIVDYAHTPDALQNVLSTLQKTKRKDQSIITVVGCGGDRDEAKRPKMAAISAQLSDKVILTSDNPRTEDPKLILNQMEEGLSGDQKNKALVIEDRRAAIKTAVMLAQENDIILVAGKGHEKYQEINKVKHPFEDKKELLDALQASK